MDYIRPTPQQNPLLGLLAERLKQAQGFAAKPFGYSNPPAEMLMSLLGIPAVQQTMERMAYGEPLTTGRGMTTQVRPEVAEAALTVAPFVPAAGRVARGAARMAGQEIADVMSGMPSRSLLGDITPKPMQLITYHGTPHRFPSTEKNLLGEFDASKIGTGEGAQSFGYGIYVAENPSVAKDYQLMERNWFDTSKAKYKGKTIDSWYEQAQKDQERAFRTKNSALEKDANARLAYWENIMTHTHPQTVLKQFTDPEFGWDDATKYAKSIDINKFVGIPETGTLYKVDLPDDKIAKMLDWDKPLSKQSPEVQSAIEKLTGIRVDKKLLNEYDDALLNALQGGSTDLPKQPIDPLGSDLMRMISKNDKESAQKLRDQGIPGVKYFDAGSRDISEGTRNFVIFPGEEKSLRILERDGEKAPFQFPQQAALDTAQKNAALPISEGGLGLPPNNTPMDRAKAMGVDVETYHGSTSPNIQQFDVSMSGAKSGNPFDDYIFTTNNPESASGYALNWQSYKKNVEGSPEFQALEDKRKSLLKTIVKQADEGNFQNVGDIKQEISLINDQKIKLYNDFMEGKYVSEDATVYPLMTRSADFMPYEASGQNWMKANRPAIEASQEAGYSGVNIQNVKDNAGKGYDLITDTYATNNPSLLRSRFAAFDPMRRNESDILAGLLPASLLADPETRRKLDEELSLLYTK
jgi:hypothetical protein